MIPNLCTFLKKKFWDKIQPKFWAAHTTRLVSSEKNSIKLYIFLKLKTRATK